MVSIFATSSRRKFQSHGTIFLVWNISQNDLATSKYALNNQQMLSLHQSFVIFHFKFPSKINLLIVFFIIIIFCFKIFLEIFENNTQKSGRYFILPWTLEEMCYFLQMLFCIEYSAFYFVSSIFLCQVLHSTKKINYLQWQQHKFINKCN